MGTKAKNYSGGFKQISAEMRQREELEMKDLMFHI